MITIVNYGLGNVLAIANIYRRLGIAVQEARTAEDLATASRIILPGVGAFDWAIMRLEQSGMRPALEDLVCRKSRPVLGICVGMQMLAEHSDEGRLAGLGWIPGEVKRFDSVVEGKRRQLPHMGWNDVEPLDRSSIFQGLESGMRFYFLHSYYFVPKRPEDVLARTSYGHAYASSVRCGSVFGVQFHPEKSHQWGIRLLKNFAEI
jgi:imidazole glycerol-phosphate synthase subunit HisH